MGTGTVFLFLLFNAFLVQDGRTFIICSLVVRALEGLGNAAFLTSSFSLVAQLFTNSVATVFALGEKFNEHKDDFYYRLPHILTCSRVA
jgi:hypothetical protein